MTQTKRLLAALAAPGAVLGFAIGVSLLAGWLQQFALGRVVLWLLLAGVLGWIGRQVWRSIGDAGGT